MSLWFKSLPFNLKKGKIYVATQAGLRHQKDEIGTPFLHWKIYTFLHLFQGLAMKTLINWCLKVALVHSVPCSHLIIL